MTYRSFSHWLQYNGKYLVYAGIFLLLFAILRYTNGKAEQYDYRISWVGVTSLTASESDALAQTVSRLGKDLDGDGAVTLDLEQYLIDFSEAAEDPEALERSYRYLNKLLARLQEKDCYLFLLEDPERFQSIVGVLRYLDGKTPGEENRFEAAHWNDMVVPLHIDGSDRAVWLARRSLFEPNADYEAVFPGGEALFSALAAQG